MASNNNFGLYKKRCRVHAMSKNGSYRIQQHFMLAICHSTQPKNKSTNYSRDAVKFGEL